MVQPPPVFNPLQSRPRLLWCWGRVHQKGLRISALKILKSNKIPIHMIVGTSAGSVVGSLYAYRMDAFSLQKLSFSVQKEDIVDVIYIPSNGFIKGEKLEEFIDKTVNYTPMEKLKIPFYAVATDLEGGQEMVFGKGNTGTAVGRVVPSRGFSGP